MQITQTEIAEVKILKPILHADDRGFFSEVFRKPSYEKMGSTYISSRKTIPCP